MDFEHTFRAVTEADRDARRKATRVVVGVKIGHIIAEKEFTVSAVSEITIERCIQVSARFLAIAMMSGLGLDDIPLRDPCPHCGERHARYRCPERD